jgi:uncharacterized protein (TIGR03083 family)
MTEPVLELLEQVWSSIEELCSGLEPGQWTRSTECPGWDVKDQLAHMCGIESRLLGRPQPEPAPDRPSHVRNDLGALNEAQIELRRPWAAEKVLEEFREVTAQRLRVLAGLDPEAWDTERETPLGRAKTREHIAIRVVDSFYHEQDIRRATERPGHMNGAVARHTYERMRGAMPFVVAKRAQAPDGTKVVFLVEAPRDWMTGPFEVGVEAGRGSFTGSKGVGAPVAATLTFDLESFLRFAGGRWSAERGLGEGRVRIQGDEALARRILEGMAVTP